MNIKNRNNIIIFIGISILVAVLIAGYLSYQISDKGKSNFNSVVISIPQGVSAKDIADKLYSNEVISNKNWFLLLTKITFSSKKLQAGIYKFQKNTSPLKALFIMRSGKTFSIKFTVPEGYTIRQIAELIEKMELGSSKKFLDIATKSKLEGFLFPDTYFLPPNITIEEIIKIMNKQFNIKYSEKFTRRAEELKMDKIQVITLASIIEKEAKTNNEKRIVSAVFHNRLKKGWPLESCATVRYALNKYKGNLSIKDISVKSPYNTYIHTGLPPGPICNPGIESIEAALYPANSDAMYFLTKDGNTHYFSKDYKEHIKEKKRR